MVSTVCVSLGNALTSPLQQSACALTSSSFLGAQVCPLRLTPGCKTQSAKVEARGTGFFKLPGTLKRKVSETAENAKPASKPGSILQKFQLPGTKRVQPSDPNTVFVAGATGKVGIRTVRELSALGFKVRAGVRSVQKAEEALAFASQYDLLTSQQARNIQLVEYDLTDPGTLPAAIGNAGKVVAAIGAGESSASDVKGPYKVDGQGAKALIRAAVEANVTQFVLVSSLGAGKVGFPAALLNLFWGVLVWKRQAEVELENSGMAFTIVRPGGMERPGDDYKRTHNVRLAPANTEFGGQVSQLQVSEVIGAVLTNPELSENKIVEVVAETSAPLVPLPEQLKGLPVTGLTQAERAEKKRKDAEEEAKREEQRREAEARAAEEAAEAERRRVEAEEERERQRIAAERRQEAARELQELRAQEAEARREADAAEREAQQAQARAERLLAELQEAAQAAKEARAIEKAALQAARQGQVFGSKERADVLAEVRAESRPAAVSLDRETKRTADEAKSKAAAAKKKQQAAESARVKAEEEQKAEDDKEKAAQAKEKSDAAAAKQKEADAKKAAEAKRKEEQSAKEAEAKKADEEAKKKAEAKKAEEETKKKEAQAKAEKEAEAKRAKAKEEEDKKKAEEAKAAEAAEKKKQEEEAKVQAKARADAEAQQAAEKKKKEEEERRKKEAEAKAKPAAPAPKKEEERPKVTATASAAVSEAKSALEEPKSLLGGFRWPWQAPPAEEQKQQESAPAAKSSTDLPPSPTPLSPYPMYEDLKPPTSPTPTPAGGSKGAAAGLKKEGEKAVAEVKKEAPKAVAEVKKEAPKVADDAKKEGAKVVDKVKTEGTKIVDDAKKEAPKAVDDAKKEGSKVVEAVKKEAPKAADAVKDAAKEGSKVVEKAGGSLPDAAKDAASKVTAAAKDAQKSEPVKAVANKVEDVIEEAQGFQWPWKSSDAPEPVQEAAKAVKGFKWPWEGESEEGDTKSSGAQGNGAFPKSPSLDLPYANRPLSPYTQYADLKPPTSPTPSPPVEVKKRAENDSAGTESSVKKTLIRD